MSSNVIEVPKFQIQRYSLNAYSTYIRLNLKLVENIFPLTKLEKYDKDCTIYHKDDFQKIFLYRFGTVVFFNIPTEEHLGILSQIGINPINRNRITEDDDIARDDFQLKVEPGAAIKVEFNAVTIPELSINRLEIIAQVLGQSNAMELIEWEVQDFIAESERMTKVFKQPAWFVSGERLKLLEFLGEGLSTRHKIVTQLSLLNLPDKTWESEELYALYMGLYKMFDFEQRVTSVDKKLEISSDVTEYLLEIHHNTRSEILEIIVVILILFEVIRPFFGH